MKIQSNHNINFGIKRLYKASLKQNAPLNNEKDEEVYVSVLDNEDKKRIGSIYGYWGNSMFGHQIIKDYIFDVNHKSNTPWRVKEYYVLECPESDSPEHIKGFAEANVYQNQVYVPMIQTDAQIKNKKDLKGCGSLMLYGIVKTADEKKKDSISLVPTEAALLFYEKLGFKPVPPDSIEYIMQKHDFKRLEKYLENKYSISPVE